MSVGFLDYCPKCKSPVKPGDIYCRTCGINIVRAQNELVHSLLHAMEDVAVEDFERQKLREKQRQKEIWSSRIMVSLLLVPIFVALSAFLFWLGTVATFIGAMVIGVLISFYLVLPIIGVRGRCLLNNFIVYTIIGISFFLMYLIGSVIVNLLR